MNFALVGNPNSGKTTLFNALTGSTAKVGNWPGVTVDLKEGKYKGNLSEAIRVIDLPGIYSLSPYSPEEVVARNYILDEKPDLIINIVDATNLERNLYLTTQLLESDCPLIVALNMSDLVEKDGIKIDYEMLEKYLGVPIVSISALRSLGIDELMDKAFTASKHKRDVKSVVSNSSFGLGFDKIVNLLREDNSIDNVVFRAVKILEGDNVGNTSIDKKILAKAEEIKNNITLDPIFGNDFEAAIADSRYRYITKRYKRAFIKIGGQIGNSHSDKLDRIFTNKYIGIPIFLLMMFLIFHLTFSENLFFVTGLPSPGVWLASIVENIVGIITIGFGNFLTSVGVLETSWVYGLIINGLFAGVGAVLGFLPYILFLYLFLSIMEDSGYMARAAFIMDKLFTSLGLSGKAFIPLLMGFGCSVPAITATRTLENENERKLTILMMTGFSCGAKLPIWTMFAAAFFPQNTDLMIFGIYLIGILVMLLAAYILKRTIFKGKVAPFIMELPPYHMPQFRNTMLHLWDKLRDFMFRATTIIAGSTIVIWFLSNFNLKLQMVEASSKESILGMFGNLIRPLFVPLGFATDVENGWKVIVAILTGLVAKEMVVSTMGVLYPTAGIVGNALENEVVNAALVTQIAGVFTPLAAISFMVFNLLTVPCMAAVASASVELKSKKWTFIIIGLWLLVAYTASFIIYQGGTLISRLIG